MSKCPSKACMCVALTLWILVGVSVLVVCGFAYLKPYLKANRYKQTTCRVESSFYTTQFICRCGSNCQSSYPCLLVHVSLNKSADEMVWVTLYQDNKQKLNVVEKDPDEQEWCSLKVCAPDTGYNRKTVDDFHTEFGRRGMFVECSYDSEEITQGAVLRFEHPGLEVLHTLLWPLGWTMIGVVLCVIFCKRCRRAVDGVKPEAGRALPRSVVAANASGVGTKLDLGNLKDLKESKPMLPLTSTSTASSPGKGSKTVHCLTPNSDFAMSSVSCPATPAPSTAVRVQAEGGAPPKPKRSNIRTVKTAPTYGFAKLPKTTIPKSISIEPEDKT